MKLRKMARPAVLVLLALLAGALVLSCDLPAYQLYYDVEFTDLGGGSLAVSYYLENIGREDMVNARIGIEIEDSSGPPYIVWLSGHNLDVGEYVGDPFMVVEYIDYTGTLFEAEVAATGWDTD